MAKKKSMDLFEEDHAPKEQNEFEALLNSSGIVARGLRPGDRFRGEILSVSGSEAFISTGTPVDAVLPISPNAEPLKTGEFVDVVVVRARDGEVMVKIAGSVGVGGDADSLEDAFDMEIPVEGVVLEAIKGGFRIKVQGQKAFCPISQIDFNCSNPADYVGRKFDFIITKFEGGRDIVVSRRKLLDLERASAEGDFLKTVEPGSIFMATITRLERYGAFCRLENGIEGLIPVSEMAWNRIHHPQEVVNLGQVVQVKLLQAVEDGSRLKVSFSLKQGGSVVDPWATLENDFPVGTPAEGTVERKESFGLFINIANGVTGLLPRSAWRDAVDGSQFENKRRGDKVKVRVDRIDLDSRKLSFSLPRDDEDDSWRSHETSAPSKSLGTLADLLKNVKIKT